MSEFLQCKAPLTTQSRKVCIVIRNGVEISQAKLKEYCETRFERYAFIEHKDTYDEDGILIPVHYHITGDMIGSKVAFSTRLNDMVSFFRFKDATGIQIDKYKSLAKCIQYLTHKNQPHKTQLDKSLIVTNIDKNEFDLMYTSEDGAILTFDELYVLCLENTNIIGVIRALGLNLYRTWRNVVWDIFNAIPRNEKYRIGETDDDK